MEIGNKRKAKDLTEERRDYVGKGRLEKRKGTEKREAASAYCTRLQVSDRSHARAPH